MKTMLACLAVLTLAGSVANASLKNSEFSQQYWSSKGCGLNVADFALLQSLRDQLGQAKKTYIGSPETVVATDPGVFTAQDRNFGIPGIHEARVQLINEKAALAGKTWQQLVVAATSNEHLKACTLTLSKSKKEYMSDMLHLNAPDKYLLEGEISLLQVIGLDRTVLLGKESGSRYLTGIVTPEELVDQEYTAFYAVNDVVRAIERGASDAIELNMPVHEEVRLASSVHSENGVSRLSVSAFSGGYPAIKRETSTFISASDQNNMLVDKTVLNSIALDPVGSLGTSMSGMSKGALEFQVGTSKRDGVIAKHLVDCLKNFKGSLAGKNVQVEVAAFVNHSCRTTDDDIILMIPADGSKVASYGVDELNAKLATIKDEQKAQDALGAATPALLYKEFLRLAGRSTDFDYVSEGKLLVGSRAAFEAALKRAKITNVQVNEFVDELSVMLAGGSPKNKDVKAQFQRFLFQGGLQILMSIMASDYDEVLVKVGQKASGNKVEILGLVSMVDLGDQVLAAAGIGKIGGALSNERSQLIMAKVKSATSCISQTALFEKALAMLATDTKSRASQLDAVNKIEKMSHLTSLAMSQECSDLTIKPVLEKVIAARKLLKRGKL